MNADPRTPLGMPANLGRGHDDTMTEMLQFHDSLEAYPSRLGNFTGVSYRRKNGHAEWPGLETTLSERTLKP